MNAKNRTKLSTKENAAIGFFLIENPLTQSASCALIICTIKIARVVIVGTAGSLRRVRVECGALL